MADNKQRVRQHEPLRVPQGWTDQARSLVMQIERVFDKIFSLLGKHREDIDGKKDKQTAKTSPSASGSTLAFIDTISQDEEGVITATKKNVSVANNLTTTEAGSVLDARQGKSLDDGKKNTQIAKSDPSADGVSTSFIATLSQNTQGVITATKKNVAESFSIPASGSKTFNIGKNFRGVFFIMGGAAAIHDVITASSTSAGTVVYQKMGSSANLTVTTSTGAINIASSSTAISSCYVMTFNGSVS